MHTFLHIVGALLALIAAPLVCLGIAFSVSMANDGEDVAADFVGYGCLATLAGIGMFVLAVVAWRSA